MTNQQTHFVPVQLSLRDLVGSDHATAIVAARSHLTGESLADLDAVASERIDLYPESLHQRLTAMLPEVGTRVVPQTAGTAAGATSTPFALKFQREAAPLSALGYYRVGEDGRLYLTAKGEHYHVSVGHGFPGFRLLDIARRLGIPNATHNNTRGHITRLLEEELVAAANGIQPGQRAALGAVLCLRDLGVPNRVLNLETGSVAAEAAIKMVLGRFYRSQEEFTKPPLAGLEPVLVVMGNLEGGIEANYHGTAMIAQMMRGMWPDLYDLMQRAGAARVAAVRPNRVDDLEDVFARYGTGATRIAGLFCELVMMNYGGIRLSGAFVQRAAELCRQYAAPLVVDEIQTGLWSPTVFMVREYGVQPTMIVIGKGFPGGEYAASRLIFSAEMDSLPQFGALVTSGQEELASLAYLVTMRWAHANAEVIVRVGDYYQERLGELAARYPQQLSGIEGARHLAGIAFHDLERANVIVRRLNRMGLDISIQSYKATCPPSALTKLPLIMGFEAVDLIVERLDRALSEP
ncbi:MAG: aminotransferase class III-fold pyridoxal phosphate-dependent enzyme [Anaerolineae bacterium]